MVEIWSEMVRKWSSEWSRNSLNRFDMVRNLRGKRLFVKWFGNVREMVKNWPEMVMKWPGNGQEMAKKKSRRKRPENSGKRSRNGRDMF